MPARRPSSGSRQRAQSRAGRRAAPPARSRHPAAAERDERRRPPILDQGPSPVPARPPLVLRARRLQALRLPLLRRAGPRRARRRSRRGGRGFRAARPTSATRPPTRELADPEALNGDAPPRGRRRRQGPRQRGSRRARVERASRAGRRPATSACGRCSRTRASRTSERSPARSGADRRLARAASCAPSSTGWRSGPRRHSSCRSPARSCAATSTCSRAGSTDSVVVDYKTDRVGSDGTAALGDRYAAQRAVYALAAAGGGIGPSGRPTSSSSGRTSRWSRCSTPPPWTPRAQRLEGLLAQIRSGIFEPAAEPYAALCFGCPAAPRLCPRPKWRPRRDAPAALR